MKFCLSDIFASLQEICVASTFAKVTVPCPDRYCHYSRTHPRWPAIHWPTSQTLSDPLKTFPMCWKDNCEMLTTTFLWRYRLLVSPQPRICRALHRRCNSCCQMLPVHSDFMTFSVISRHSALYYTVLYIERGQV